MIPCIHVFYSAHAVMAFFQFPVLQEQKVTQSVYLCILYIIYIYECIFYFFVEWVCVCKAVTGEKSISQGGKRRRLL